MFASSLVAILNEVATSGKGLTAHLGTVTKIVKIVKGRAGHTTRPDLLETCCAPPTPLSEIKLQQENGSYSRGFRHQPHRLSCLRGFTQLLKAFTIRPSINDAGHSFTNPIPPPENTVGKN
jgi:hypothetical protein